MAPFGSFLQQLEGDGGGEDGPAGQRLEATGGALRRAGIRAAGRDSVGLQAGDLDGGILARVGAAAPDAHDGAGLQGGGEDLVGEDLAVEGGLVADEVLVVVG